MRIKNWIKECCASCQHREIEEEGTRICTEMQIYVKRKYKCSNWKLNKGFKDGRKGRVKRREYLMFVLAIRTLEQDAIDDGIMKPEDITLNAVLRKRFEEIYGLSPYLIY